MKSRRGILFRRWATQVLKRYLLNGYSINEERCIVCHKSVLQIENKLNEIGKKRFVIIKSDYLTKDKLLK